MGNDYLFVRVASGELYGGDGNDTLAASMEAWNRFTLDNSTRTFFGGEGSDFIALHNGNNTVYGGNGNNTIYADDGRNVVFTEAGSDAITFRTFGQHYTQRLYGGVNTDTLIQDFTIGQDVIRLEGWGSTRLPTGPPVAVRSA